jgi:hypothetical protein
MSGPVKLIETRHMEVMTRDGIKIVKIVVDFDALAARLGPRALESKGGKSTDAGGAVVVYS